MMTIGMMLKLRARAERLAISALYMLLVTLCGMSMLAWKIRLTIGNLLLIRMQNFRFIFLPTIQ